MAQLGDHGVQALSLDELHGVEADVTIVADLEDRHDIGVVQSWPRRGPRGETARASSGRRPRAGAAL